MQPVKPFLSAGEPARIWMRSTRRRFETAPGRHAELVVLLGLSGRANYFLDGEMLPLHAQSVLFCPPGRAHFLVSETRDFDMVIAVFTPSILKDAPIHPNGTPSDTSPRLRLLARPAFQEASILARQLIDAERGAMKTGIGWWLHRVWSLSDPAVPMGVEALHPKVSQAIELLYADPGIALGKLARIVDLTPTRLGQLFRRQTGQTLSAFRSERRFAAYHRLCEQVPNGSLLAAAMEAGFGDYSSFYRAYRKRYGAAPRAGKADG